MSPGSGGRRSQKGSSVEVILARFKQANLLFDAELWEMLRKVNDQVKAQGKHEPELAAHFTVLLDFMRRAPRGGGGGPVEGGGGGGQ